MARLVALLLTCSAWTVGLACGPLGGEGRPAPAFEAVVRALEPGLASTTLLDLPADGRIILEHLRAAGGDGADDAGLRAFEALVRTYGGRGIASAADLRADAELRARWLSDVAAGVRTRAVLVVDDGDRDTVTHAAVYWNSPLIPRMRVVRIPEAARTRDNREQVLALLGTCAVPVDAWVSAPESLALRFLAEHVEASMLVVAREPDAGEAVQVWIAPDDVVAALRFEHVATAELGEFSAWFAGGRPDLVQLTRLLPSLRSSLGPGELWAWIRSLP